MNDWLTKLILIAIALGLWANAASTIVRPTPARADAVDNYISDIAHSLHVIAYGQCGNSKIC
jgi:hypothetical protein